MLKNIKLSYFSKLIFSLLEEGRRLKIVKYNKIFQKNLDIRLINYKLFSGKYIIYETNKIVIKKMNILNKARQQMAEFEDNQSKINLRDIKSSYIIKRIFSFLHENQTLEMIVYSKEFQKMCLKGIKNYKAKCKKYKIGGKNGNGKEYIINTNILIFEGEYLNGKRNGKGKEFYKSGKLKFEGEYLNGKRWNGNGYNKNGDIGLEIKDGKGNIKEYDYDDNLKFEGIYLKGEKNGKGKEYNFGELEFEGEYSKGKRNGKGKEF